MFNGTQKNERTVAVLLDRVIHTLPLIIDPINFHKESPIIIRNQTINLKKESTKKIFPLLSNQESTEIDILFINDTSPLGHSSSINYYVEVEMANRDAKALNRLYDFTTYCTQKGISLFPILITNLQKTQFNKGACFINFNDLQYLSDMCLSTLKTPLNIPGVAWDDSAITYHILDLVSQQFLITKRDLNKKLVNNPILYRKKLDFDTFTMPNKTLLNSLIEETPKDFRHRIHDLLKKIEKCKLIKDSSDKRSYQLTSLGTEYVIKWWGNENG